MIKEITFIRAVLISLLILSLSGCFSEDYSFCPPESAEDNVRLDFRLPNGEAFREKVTTVDVGIFDGTGYFVKFLRIDRDDIHEYEGMATTLEPGDYRMVFWANISDNTKIDGTDRVTYSRMAGTEVGNGDKVYYAPGGASRAEPSPLEYYGMTVPEDDTYTDVVYFTHAHRTIEIYIKGLSHNPVAMPTVEITGLPFGHGYFGMGSLDVTPVTSSQATTLYERDDIVYARALFHTFRFSDLDGIGIVVRDGAGSELYTIPLAEAVRLVNGDPDKLVIELILSFMNGTVEVSIPGWSSGETGIEF